MQSSANKKQTAVTISEDKIINAKTPFLIQEAYKNLRTNLSYALAGDSISKKILMTSSIESEGKSTTTVNLAIVIAQKNSKVLIIDCDLRKPRIHKYLKVNSENGLSSYLSGQSDYASLIRPTSQENLFIAPAGQKPPNPSELLSSKRMAALIAEAEKHFDYILFDTTPLEAVSDALIIVPHCEGVVIVTKHRITTHPSLQRTIRKLEFASAKLLGLVLNGFGSKNTYKYIEATKNLTYHE